MRSPHRSDSPRLLPAVSVALSITFGLAPARAGQLVDSGAMFPAAPYATTAFGDVDLDGDLDLLLTGFLSPNNFSRIYRNDGPSGWTDLGAGLIGVRSGAAAFGDLDGDGDLDLLLTGDAGSAVARIYRNDGGAFVDTGAPLRPVIQSSVALADIDNDGDLDVALMGITTGGQVTRFYRNDHGAFSEIDQVGVLDLHRGSLDFGDADGDDDLDLVVTGSVGFSGTHSDVYRNDGGHFLGLQAGLLNLFDGAARWADYDLDGDLDILENGSDSTSTQVFTKLYRNQGLNTFAPVAVALEGAGEGAALAWGDYDADGDPDFAALAVGFNSMEVFRNDAGITFPNAGEVLTGVCCGSIAWGDVDRDGDLDFIVGSISAPTKLYRNLETVPNTPPSAPADLVANVGSGVVTFGWSAAGDLETVPPGLTYNLRVGTTPGGSEVMPAMADPVSGRRLVPAPGNAGPGLSWKLTGLAPGTYFWSVQAIDPGFEGSEFAPEESFIVGPTSAIEAGTGVAQVGGLSLAVERRGTSGILLRYRVPDRRQWSLSVIDVTGRRVRILSRGTGPVADATLFWQPLHLPSAVYFLELAGGGESTARRVLWTR